MWQERIMWLPTNIKLFSGYLRTAGYVLQDHEYQF